MDTKKASAKGTKREIEDSMVGQDQIPSSSAYDNVFNLDLRCHPYEAKE